jgi:hypothetical protein
MAITATQLLEKVLLQFVLKKQQYFKFHPLWNGVVAQSMEFLQYELLNVLPFQPITWYHFQTQAKNRIFCPTTKMLQC